MKASVFKALVCLFLFGTMYGAYAATTQPPLRYYKAQFQILLNDSLVAHPSAIVLANHTVTTILPVNGKLYKFRYTLGDSIVTSNGSEGVWVNAEIYAAQGDKWIEVATPRVALLLGQEGSLNVEGHDATQDPWAIGLSVTATKLSTDEVKTLFHGKIPEIHKCSLNSLSPQQVIAQQSLSSGPDSDLADGARPNLVDPQVRTSQSSSPGSVAPQACCGAGCRDGTNRYMRCCGAIACCACGVCCSVP